MTQTEKRVFQKGLDPVTKDYLVNLNLQIFTKSENPLTEVENEEDDQKTENANNLSASLLENIHTELKGKEVDISYDKKCSRIYERLLKMSTFPHLVEVYKQLLVAKEKGRKDLFVKMMIHLFASHVLETLLTLCAQKMREKSFGVNELTIKSLLSSLGTIFQVFHCDFCYKKDIRGELRQLIEDKYASHVIRTLLSSTRTILDNSTKSSESPALIGELHLFIQALEELPINDLIFHPSASPVFQVLTPIASF